MATKTYMPGVRTIINRACRFVTRYRATIEATVVAVVPAGVEREAILSWIQATVDTCAVVNKYFPDIP